MPSIVSPQYEAAKRTGTLSLPFLSLNQIPSLVFTLTNITRLDISNNNIKTIPQEIRNLNCLEQFWLYDNPIISLPVELQFCRKLKTLDLRNTLIETIPTELGRLNNLYEISLQGTPLSDELIPFKGSTDELLLYLSAKDKKTELTHNMISSLLSSKYLEIADMIEGSIIVKSLVLEVCKIFTVYAELSNVARNAERLFPIKYASPVLLRSVFTSFPTNIETVSNRNKRWVTIANNVAVVEAKKLKKSYIKMNRETQMIKLSADMSLKISSIYYDNHDPSNIEGWLKDIYTYFTPDNYISEGKEVMDLEDIQFVIAEASLVFPTDSLDITGELIRRNMINLQEKLIASRMDCINGIRRSLLAIYSDRENEEVMNLAFGVSKLFERSRFASVKELEDLKKIKAHAVQLFPKEFQEAKPDGIRKAFRIKERMEESL